MKVHDRTPNSPSGVQHNLQIPPVIIRFSILNVHIRDQS